MITLAVIGYRGHALRLIEHAKSFDDVRLDFVYQPYIIPPESELTCLTNSWDDVTSCDAVIVASPTYSHADYMRLLRDEKQYTGYILCEKPPYIKYKDITHFQNYDDKTSFNFNFEFGKFSELFDMGTKHELGTLINVDVHMTHGFAFTQKYARSWRCHTQLHELGVIETVGSHWIDMMYLKFADVMPINVDARNISGHGDACDTAVLQFACDNANVNILVSYAAEARCMMSLQYSHGSVVLDEEKLTIKKQGKLVKKTKFNVEDAYQESLRLSLGSFIDCVKQRGKTDTKQYARAIDTCRALVNIKEILSEKSA